jgi:spermidine synthase
MAFDKPMIRDSEGFDWVVEQHSQFFMIGYRVKKHLFSGQSDFQKVDVYETEGHGKLLMNDNLAMVSDRDEYIYHEMMAHIPLFTHPHPKRVLVIGGGDGGTAREVLRHTSVESVRMVEIDKMVVDASKEFIPVTASCLSDERITVDINDAVKFVAETNEKFDVVMVDSTDPIGPATPLFGIDFYKNIYKILEDDGVVVSQGESPFYEQPMQVKLMSIVSELFPITSLYNFTNLTYPGGLWSFTFASKKFHPLKDFNRERVLESGIDFRYYNEDLHSACFALPSFMRNSLRSYIKL